MGTRAIETLGDIAVMTEDLIARRKAFTLQPLIEVVPAASEPELLAVPPATTVDVIDSKKRDLRLTTASALGITTAVVYKDLQLEGLVVPTV